jgi:integrase
MNEKRARGTGRIFRQKKSPYLWLQYYLHGEQIRVSAKTNDEKKAAKKLRRLIGQVEADVHPEVGKLSYEAMRAAFFLDYENNNRKSLRRDREGKLYLDKVVRLDGFFSGYHAREISTDMIRRFIKNERDRGLGNGTINRSLSALRRMFNLAVEDGKLRDVPHFPMLKEPAPRKGFFERADYDGLLRVLPDYLRVPFAIGYFTGMREGEILGLRWEQIDLLGNVIELMPGETKNDSARTIPIVPELRALLLEQRTKRQPKCEFVCYKLDDKGHAGVLRSFRKAWCSSCVQAGLGHWEPVFDAEGKPLFEKPRGPRSKPKQKQEWNGRIFHDLRRSGVRNLIRAGVSRDVARRVSGHATDSVFSRYNITSQADVRDAGRKLSEYHKSLCDGDTTGIPKPEPKQATASIN